MPANSSGKYRGRRLDLADASIRVTFRDARARFVTRFRCFI